MHIDSFDQVVSSRFEPGDLVLFCGTLCSVLAINGDRLTIIVHNGNYISYVCTNDVTLFARRKG